MKLLKKIYKNCNNYLYEHSKFRLFLDYLVTLFFSLISAFCFAYGFRAFIAPNIGDPLISGGVSGFSQVLIRLGEIIFHNSNEFSNATKNNLQAILYFVINIPLFFLAFSKIGKRFAIFSMINVVLVSILIAAIPDSWANVFSLNDDAFLERAIFAGLLTGISTALAVRFGHSAGGVDIISIYISSKTHSSMGKYLLIFNAIIILSFTFLKGPKEYANKALYSIVYLFVVSRVVDALCLRNKKLQLQIITESEEMAQILITNLPHSCTIVDGKGAYKGTPRKIIYMDVSASEIKTAVKVAREVDSKAFISVLHVHNLYGRFYLKPIK